ncbi:hypothetical protein [Cognatishimia activa]|uniref:ApeA N-terminal domain-containing protein n=1 Tax=Cognatishimia activa TaxID=1715691 RepID=A0A975EMY6_9RHOB|nr:hypothetical protein [Cognatishimia activa]QTN34672.1 hypothetical protein HZ995_09125 [Cognatishimia activa]
MLEADQFFDTGNLPSFTIEVESLEVDGKQVGPTKIETSYGQEGEISFSLGTFAPDGFSALRAKFEIKYKAQHAAIPVIVTERTAPSGADPAKVTATPNNVPCILVDTKTASSFSAVLWSAPKFLNKPIVLEYPVGTVMKIIPFRSDHGSPCKVESNVRLSSEKPWSSLRNFIRFMTFLKGANCGFGNVFAFQENGEIAFRMLGFTKVDVSPAQTNWFDIELQNELPNLYKLFCVSRSDLTTCRALDQTINFYRAASLSRKIGPELALIAAHSALEAIVNFILQYRADWSKSMLANRTISFADKSRSAASHAKVNEGLLDKSPRLQEYSKSNNNIDAFELISRFRNILVHQDFREGPTGIELHEAWSITMWLVEVLIFAVIGYRGEIIDRRNYDGYRGETCLIPNTEK